MSRAFIFFTDFSCFIMIETQHNFNNILAKEREEQYMKNILGFTMVAVGLTRILTGGFILGTVLVLWGFRILRKANK